MKRIVSEAPVELAMAWEKSDPLSATKSRSPVFKRFLGTEEVQEYVNRLPILKNSSFTNVFITFTFDR